MSNDKSAKKLRRPEIPRAVSKPHEREAMRRTLGHITGRIPLDDASNTVPPVTSNTSEPVTSEPPPAASNTPENASKLAPPEIVTSNLSTSITSNRKTRHSAAKTQYNNRIDTALYIQIKHFCADERLSQAEFAELSASHFMQAVTSNKRKADASLLSHDDRGLTMVWKTEPAIINLYLRYNPENRWRPADDRLAVAYNGADVRALELGIIDTQINAGFKRVHSFKYYTGQIDIWTAQAMDDATLDLLVSVARRRWSLAREGK